IKATSAANCSDIKPVTVTVIPTPTANAIGNQTVCNATNTTTVQFTGTATSFSWTNDNISIGLVASGTGDIASFTATNSGTSPVTATITVMPHYTINSVTCDGASTTFTIIVYPT